MTTADPRGGSLKLDDIRFDLEAADRTPAQRREAFERLGRRRAERPDDADAKALWERFADEFGRASADAPLRRDTDAESFEAPSKAERAHGSSG